MDTQTLHLAPGKKQCRYSKMCREKGKEKVIVNGTEMYSRNSKVTNIKKEKEIQNKLNQHK